MKGDDLAISETASNRGLVIFLDRPNFPVEFAHLDRPLDFFDSDPAAHDQTEVGISGKETERWPYRGHDRTITEVYLTSVGAAVGRYLQ
jgi:hypothetical protein